MIIRLNNDVVAFPDGRFSSNDPDGLLAVGGKLTPEWLLTAYRQGIFPWFNDDEAEALWWCPAQRAVINPGEMRVPRSLRKTIKNHNFEIKADQRFEEVIQQCANTRREANGTWITEQMIRAYCLLHDLGFAHSIEVYEEEKLIGGLYGLAIGQIFSGESMFHLKRDASKLAFYYLNEHLSAQNYNLIDCQIMNPHLSSLGAYEMPRDEFLDRIEKNNALDTNRGKWLVSAEH